LKKKGNVSAKSESAMRQKSNAPAPAALFSVKRPGGRGEVVGAPYKRRKRKGKKSARRTRKRLDEKARRRTALAAVNDSTTTEAGLLDGVEAAHNVPVLRSNEVGERPCADVVAEAARVCNRDGGQFGAGKRRRGKRNGKSEREEERERENVKDQISLSTVFGEAVRVGAGTPVDDGPLVGAEETGVASSGGETVERR
jgi:hypothetical protein